MRDHKDQTTHRILDIRPTDPEERRAINAAIDRDLRQFEVHPIGPIPPPAPSEPVLFEDRHEVEH